MKKVIAATLSIILSVSSFSSLTFAANKEFKDVASGDWFYKDVQNLAGLGAISGFYDGTFKPQGTITRAEFVKILVTALKLKSTTGNEFADTKNHWAKDSISTAITNEIVMQAEYTKGFEPDKSITRQEMAKMMLRALKVSPSVSSSGTFADTADGFTEAAYNELLIMGTVEGGSRYFYPEANATRAEASAIIVRAVDYSKDSRTYKAQKQKELNERNGLPEDLSIEDRSSEVKLEDVQSLPDTVLVNSPEEYARKIMTAAYLKKPSITIKVRDYNENYYGFDSILKIVKTAEFEKCYQKGYSAGYEANISTIGSSAEVTLKFTYTALDEYESKGIIKVYSADDLRKALKKGILAKESEINVAIKEYDPGEYDLDKILELANDESVITKGYCAKYQGTTYIDDKGSRIIYIDIYYTPLSYTFSSLQKLSSYDEFVTALRECVTNKKRLFNVLINNYDSETYNLGNILKELNANELSKSGYYAKVLNKSVENTTPAIYHILFTYPAYTEGTSLEGGKDILVPKNEKEWYDAVKSAITNLQDSIKYDSVYSAEMGDTVKNVLQMNPDISYVDKWMTGGGEIRFYYKFSRDKLLDMKEKTDQKAKQIISEIITQGMTETDKAKAIHDYIVKNAKYDYENYKNDTIPDESYTAYGILINGTGVCEGYAAAFNLLANLAGIDCTGVTGTAGGPHAWNMVKLDGKIGYIDVTWDDPVPDRAGQVRYDYFNVSAEQLGKDHKWDKVKFDEKYLDY